jgi:branched-chain amino acid aminotransferase
MAEELTYLDGKIVPASRAGIPVSDRAVLYGDSVFETVRAYNGRPFRLARHLERLEEGCRLTRMTLPIPPAEIERAVADLIKANGLDRGCDSYIRVTVTGGPSAGPKGLERPGPQGIFIIVHEYEPPSEEDYQRGIAIAISGIKRNASSPLSSLKTGNCMDGLFARQEARDRGLDDSVMLTTAGNIAEGTTWNIFMVKEGELLTPNMGCGFLPGITREAVIEVALAGGVPVREIMETHETLLSCEEAFATGSTAELTPVCRVGTHLITFCPGPLTQRMRAAYRDLVERETSA